MDLSSSFRSVCYTKDAKDSKLHWSILLQEGSFLPYFLFKSLSDSFDILVSETDPSNSQQFHLSSPKHMIRTFSDPDFTNTRK